MKRLKRAQSSSLFLLELIIAILFFAIASAICVRFFVASHQLSKDANLLNHAINECSGIAELLSAEDDFTSIENSIKKAYPSGSLDIRSINGTSETITIYFNYNFQASNNSDARYDIVITLNADGTMLRNDIEVLEHKTENSTNIDSIYSLHVNHHIQQEI